MRNHISQRPPASGFARWNLTHDGFSLSFHPHHRNNSKNKEIDRHTNNVDEDSCFDCRSTGWKTTINRLTDTRNFQTWTQQLRPVDIADRWQQQIACHVSTASLFEWKSHSRKCEINENCSRTFPVPYRALNMYVIEERLFSHEISVLGLSTPWLTGCGKMISVSLQSLFHPSSQKKQDEQVLIWPLSSIRPPLPLPSKQPHTPQL